MKSGFGKTWLAYALLVGLTCVTGLVPDAVAQTPQDACAADSLYLISPDRAGIDLRMQAVGRVGMVISWPDLNLAEVACHSLLGTEDLDFEVTAEGDFADQVDRVFAFTTPDSGAIGGNVLDKMMLNWNTTALSSGGRIGGRINLSNSGGVFHHDTDGDTWAQHNVGLPMSWARTNVVALDAGADDFLVAGFTRGTTINTEPAGLWTNSGSVWQEIRSDIFGTEERITKIVLSPTSNDVFAVGMANSGLRITRDGGTTFTEWTYDLAPDLATYPTVFRVTALDWVGSRIVLAIANMGAFYSDDGGLTFAQSDLLVSDDLDDPEAEMGLPVINSLRIDPADTDRVLAALQNHGIYESLDGGATWTSLAGDLIVPVPGYPGEWVHSALDVVVDSVDPQILVGAFLREGLYRTTDGGAHWLPVGASLQPGNASLLARFRLVAPAADPGTIYALEDKWSILRSTDSGATWAHVDSRPNLLTCAHLAVADNGSDLWLATYAGGIYVPGSPIELKDTLGPSTDDDLMDVELGLYLSFGDGVLDTDNVFQLTCQTFQGWAVWRAPGHDRQDMTLLGLYDRVNPETCIQGYCGDEDYVLDPICYRAKRAACFNFDTPDTIRFFDFEIYNGFSYNYAVTTFDYGNTAELSAQGLNKEMLFSPRWTGDPDSPFTGEGNTSFTQINAESTDPYNGQEIYVYPNPLRPGAGIPGAEGQQVVFTNLPPESHVRVFTTAGDDVADLGPDLQIGGNIYWDTVNKANESVAAGVYIYKVEMPARQNHWGRLIIIR